MKRTRERASYHLMVIPGILLLAAFSLLPMGGLVMAFNQFNPGLGVFRSPWVGLSHFRYLTILPDFSRALINTLVIAGAKIMGNLTVALAFALALNEVRLPRFTRAVQTIVYLPHFISWVFLAAIFINLLSLSGIANSTVRLFGGQPVLFLGSNRWFRPILVATDIWKEYGFNAIIYLAAIVGINPALYESAEVDGAGRMRKLFHITIPGIVGTIILLAALSLGRVMEANFDQVFNLYNPLVYRTGDIIDTLVYRTALEGLQFSLGTAVGFFKSVVNFVMIVSSYLLAYRFANYRIF
jgi:putative aldouronate transport system permease protein